MRYAWTRCRSNLSIKYEFIKDPKNLQCYSRNNFTPFMYLLLLGQPVSFMHCCDTVLFQRFMHLKACNGYGLNATDQSTILSTCFYLISWKVFKYIFFNKPCSLIWSLLDKNYLKWPTHKWCVDDWNFPYRNFYFRNFTDRLLGTFSNM